MTSSTGWGRGSWWGGRRWPPPRWVSAGGIGGASVLHPGLGQGDAEGATRAPAPGSLPVAPLAARLMLGPCMACSHPRPAAVSGQCQHPHCSQGTPRCLPRVLPGDGGTLQFHDPVPPAPCPIPGGAGGEGREGGSWTPLGCLQGVTVMPGSDHGTPVPCTITLFPSLAPRAAPGPSLTCC